MRTVRNRLLLLVALALLALPSGALAASPDQIVRDCSQDGDFDRQYSNGDLRRAEGRLPTDVDEYTDCRDVINQAQIRDSSSRGGGSGGSDGSGGPGAAPTATPEDTKALAEAARGAESGNAPPLSIGGERVRPGGGGVLSTASAANHLPLPILLVLICVAAMTAAGGYVVVRRRFPEARSAALRLFRR